MTIDAHRAPLNMLEVFFSIAAGMRNAINSIINVGINTIMHG